MAGYGDFPSGGQLYGRGSTDDKVHSATRILHHSINVCRAQYLQLILFQRRSILNKFVCVKHESSAGVCTYHSVHSMSLSASRISVSHFSASYQSVYCMTLSVYCRDPLSPGSSASKLTRLSGWISLSICSSWSNAWRNLVALSTRSFPLNPLSPALSSVL